GAKQRHEGALDFACNGGPFSRIDHTTRQIEHIRLERQLLSLEFAASAENPSARHMVHEIDGLSGDVARVHPPRAPRQNWFLALVNVSVDEKVAAFHRKGRHGTGIATVEGDVMMREPDMEIDSC